MCYPKPGYFLLRIVLFGALFALFTPQAKANVGPQWWGAYASEPTGGLAEIAITRETLVIDFRPLAAGQTVPVEATYYLHNTGGKKTVHLVFVAGTNEISEFAVHLDEQLIESEHISDEKSQAYLKSNKAAWRSALSLAEEESRLGLPQFNTAAWQSAVYIGDPYPMGLVAFTVELPTGRSTLRASYRTKAVGTDEGYPTATWHVPYVLSPARTWQSFGSLDVKVQLPEGWEHLCTLPLKSDGDELRGTFEDLPADGLIVSARLPVGPEHERRVYIFTALYFLIVACGGVLCVAWGRWAGLWLWLSRKASPLDDIRILLWLSIRLSGFGWAILIWSAWWLATWGIRSPIELQESPYYHERFTLPFLASFLLNLLAVPLGIALTGATAAIYRRRGETRIK